jgi:hypothetical protein
VQHVADDEQRVRDEGEGRSGLDCVLGAILRLFEADLSFVS